MVIVCSSCERQNSRLERPDAATVIDVRQCDLVFEALQHPFHQALKRARSADQSKGHIYPFPVRWIYTRNMEGGLLLRSFGQLHVMVALLYIKST